MIGLTDPSLAIVDAATTSTIARTAARKPGGRLTDCSGGDDYDAGDQELRAGRGYVNRSGHLSIGACGDSRLGERAVQPAI